MHTNYTLIDLAKLHHSHFRPYYSEEQMKGKGLRMMYMPFKSIVGCVVSIINQEKY